ncbi:MAG TPA: hypothetical protein VES67_01635 [Vicinamibacterales bacterium]|nr:hypothetical protein [Vicinamibacterales bacterium]
MPKERGGSAYAVQALFAQGGVNLGRRMYKGSKGVLRPPAPQVFETQDQTSI